MNVRTMSLAAIISVGTIGVALAETEGGGMAATETRAGTGVYFSGPMVLPSASGLPAPVAALPRVTDVEVAQAPSTLPARQGTSRR